MSNEISKNKGSSKERIKYLVISALLAALTTMMTAYIFHIPDVKGGYTHIGDGIIYLAAALLPTSYAALAAAIGAGMADLLTAPMWIIPTVIIKALLVIPFTSKGERIINLRNIIGVFIGAVITIVGYCLAEVALVLLGAIPGGASVGEAFVAAFAISFPSAIIQPLGSAILFIALGLALDGIGFKKKYFILGR